MPVQKKENGAGSQEDQNCTIQMKSKQSNSSPSIKKKIKTQCQLISAKTLQKCLRREEPVFLAFVRPTNHNMNKE